MNTRPTKRTRKAKLKSELRDLLEKRDERGFRRWNQTNKQALALLTTFLFDRDEVVRWRAIEFLGIYASELAKTDLESVREIARRMLWGMNDESGILMWHAGEVLAEIIINVPQLKDEYSKMLPPLMELEPFQRGIHWAMAAVAQENKGIFEGEQSLLLESLSNKDPYIRAMAVICLSSMKESEAEKELEELQDDDSLFRAYDTKSGSFFETSVDEITKNLLGNTKSELAAV